MATEYGVWGGYSYAVGTETFPTLLEAAREYLRRINPSETYYPLWGDAGEDDYVLTTEFDGWTIRELESIAAEAVN
jgi:hypothetical protein